mmetsp:Transcript_69306/g.110833  ORF Transcript_69306/g.110833 Transcript_69306/m.110833 type:complete len:240 (-) Transcript_69306:1465-2184(-)
MGPALVAFSAVGLWRGAGAGTRLFALWGCRWLGAERLVEHRGDEGPAVGLGIGIPLAVQACIEAHLVERPEGRGAAPRLVLRVGGEHPCQLLCVVIHNIADSLQCDGRLISSRRQDILEVCRSQSLFQFGIIPVRVPEHRLPRDPLTEHDVHHAGPQALHGAVGPSLLLGGPRRVEGKPHEQLCHQQLHEGRPVLSGLQHRLHHVHGLRHPHALQGVAQQLHFALQTSIRNGFLGGLWG